MHVNNSSHLRSEAMRATGDEVSLNLLLLSLYLLLILFIYLLRENRSSNCPQQSLNLSIKQSAGCLHFLPGRPILPKSLQR